MKYMKDKKYLSACCDAKESWNDPEQGFINRNPKGQCSQCKELAVFYDANQFLESDRKND